MVWTSEEYEQAKNLLGQVSGSQKLALSESVKRYEQGEATRIGNDKTNPQALRQRAKVKAAEQRGLNPQLSGLGGGILGGGPLVEGMDHQDALSEWGARSTELEHQQEEEAKQPVLKHGAPRGPHQPKLIPSATMGDEQVVPEQVYAADKANLPSASQHPTLYRPPELMPENLDASAKMKARIEFEPSLEQFRADMGRTLGPKVMELDENAPEYKLYADSAWAQKYDAAKAAGAPIMRKAYMNKESWGEKAADMAVDFRDTLEAGGMGFGSGLTLGAAPAVAGAVAQRTGLQTHAFDDAAEQARRHPVASFAGNVLGALNPFSAVGQLGQFGNAVAPAAKTAVGGIARAAGLGAAVGGTAALGETSNRILGQAAGSEHPGEVLRGTTARDVLEPLGYGAAIGGALGAGGEALSRGAGSAVRALRGGVHAENLATAERAGATTSALGKVTAPEGIESNLGKAFASELEVSPSGLAVDKVKAPMANAASASGNKLKFRLGQENEDYYASPEGLKKNRLHSLGKKLLDVVSQRTEDGEALPMVKTAPFKKALADAVDPVLATEGEAQALAAKTGGMVMSRRAALDLGLEPRMPKLPKAGAEEQELGVVRRGGASPGGPLLASNDAVTAIDGKRAPIAPPAAKTPFPAPARPYVAQNRKFVVVIPNEVNARQLDVIVNGIDEAAGVAAGQSVKRKASGAYQELMKAVRSDQDQWLGNKVTGTRPYKLGNGKIVKGLAAMKSRHADQLLELEQTNERAGLPAAQSKNWDKMASNEQQAFETALKNAGSAGTEGEKARQALAQQAGVLKELKEIAGTSAVRALRTGAGHQQRGLNSSFARTVAGELAPGASIRLDQPMRALALSEDALSPDLVGLLRRMRVKVRHGGSDVTRQELGLREQYRQGPVGRRDTAVGLRSGGFGGKAGESAGHRERAHGKLNSEDQKNLLLLMRSAEGAQ